MGHNWVSLYIISRTRGIVLAKMSIFSFFLGCDIRTRPAQSPVQDKDDVLLVGAIRWGAWTVRAALVAIALEGTAVAW